MCHAVVMSGEVLRAQEPEPVATIKPRIVDLNCLEQVNLNLSIVALVVVIGALRHYNE